MENIIIGVTEKTFKSIYKNFENKGHKDFTKFEHLQAANLNNSIATSIILAHCKNSNSVTDKNNRTQMNRVHFYSKNAIKHEKAFFKLI